MDLREVFIKPLPEYLLPHSFWEYLVDLGSPIPAAEREDILRAVRGFVRSYAYLIQHRADYLVVTHEDRFGLVPSGISYPALVSFLWHFGNLLDADFASRYEFGAPPDAAQLLRPRPPPADELLQPVRSVRPLLRPVLRVTPVRLRHLPRPGRYAGRPSCGLGGSSTPPPTHGIAAAQMHSRHSGSSVVVLLLYSRPRQVFASCSADDGRRSTLQPFDCHLHTLQWR